jgi:integral membrane sensor domain MASE1
MRTTRLSSQRGNNWRNNRIVRFGFAGGMRMASILRAKRRGSKLISISPPSSGGTGIMLNTNIAPLTSTPAMAICCSQGVRMPSMPISAHSTPIATLAAGPASATRAVSRRGWPSRPTSIGTGLA